MREKIQERKVGDIILELRIKQVVVRPEHKEFSDLVNIPKFEKTYGAGGEPYAFRQIIPKDHVQFIHNSFKRHLNEIMRKLEK